ncbi:MAG: hypothetical protein WBW33_16590 [Bryobacteraceae bacterium]
MWNQVQQALNESTVRVIKQVANLLPGVAALIVALATSGLFAWLFTVVLRRSLRRLRFDERVSIWGLGSFGDWSPSVTPTIILTRAVYWVIMLIGLLIGISAFDATLTSEFAQRLFSYLPNVFAALILLFGGGIAARFLSRSVLIGAVNMNLQYARLLSVGVRWMVVVLTLAMVLDHLSIGGRIVYIAFTILFGGIALALSLAVGLGSKDLVSRSLEREASRSGEMESPFRHL